ncbi:MAG: hypothetical protein M3237_19340 [Actinomycetota bacterium]|nr:hypothetical protein [Actinomycetota bacterium]
MSAGAPVRTCDWRAVTRGAAEVTAFVKKRVGSVKSPQQIDVWPDLPGPRWPRC